MSEFIIGRRELYILPTRIGWYFTLILIALFAIAVKYDNQAAFMMLFILVSTSLVGMLYTHNNVIGLGMDSQPPKSVFCGETALFPLRVHNSSRVARNAVWLVSGGFHQLLDLPALHDRRIELQQPTVHRGYLVCDNVILTSHFPIGLFFCWTKRYQATQRCLVYPQPLNLVPFPDDQSNVSNRQSSISQQSNSDDYSGMKPYQPGDRLRDIHWPSLAKTHKLISIQHESKNSSAVNFSWFDLPKTLSTEDRLSQLCFWVVEAEQNQSRYQLEMPNHTIEFNTGLAHYHACLATLALWE